MEFGRERTLGAVFTIELSRHQQAKLAHSAAKLIRLWHERAVDPRAEAVLFYSPNKLPYWHGDARSARRALTCDDRRARRPSVGQGNSDKWLGRRSNTEPVT